MNVVITSHTAGDPGPRVTFEGTPQEIGALLEVFDPLCQLDSDDVAVRYLPDGRTRVTLLVEDDPNRDTRGEEIETLMRETYAHLSKEQ